MTGIWLALLIAQTKDVGLEVTRNVEYAKVDDQVLLLDVYRAQSTVSTRPAVVFIHGGGWESGSKERPPTPVAELVKSGFVSVAINYRLSGKAKFPAQIYDCKAAIRFLRLNASQYRIDPDRIGVWGVSAGGHLAALLGTSGGVEDLEGLPPGARTVSSNVQAVVSCFGPTDLVRLVDLRKERAAANLKVTQPNRGGLSPEEKLIGGTVIEKADVAKRASPLTYIDSGDPPFLFIHGEDDTLVFPEQSRLLHEALIKKGVRSELRLVKGMGHGLRGDRPTEWIVAFFQRELAPQ